VTNVKELSKQNYLNLCSTSSLPRAIKMLKTIWQLIITLKKDSKRNTCRNIGQTTRLNTVELFYNVTLWDQRKSVVMVNCRYSQTTINRS